MRSHRLCDLAASVVDAPETPWRDGVPLAADAFQAVRDETIFAACKWDPQVGDTSVLHPAPLVLHSRAWRQLANLAEGLARETIAAEHALIQRPDLHRTLGIGWRLRNAFRRARQNAASAPFRVLRFDFHWTTSGWQLSEVNSDVPGGFIEASAFTALIAGHASFATPSGDPAHALVEALAQHANSSGHIGLVHATSYTDDRQVMEFLGRLIRRRGLKPLLLSPADIRWSQQTALGHDGNGWRPLDIVHRFFPAEWLPNLGWSQPWRDFFHANAAPQINPPTALFTQSKRFPLVWDALETPLPLWRRYLPATCDPRDRTGDFDDWVLKPVFGRVGDGVDVSGATRSEERVRIHRAARRHPRYWAAQRRFHALPWSTSEGALYPAIGVYVIDGKAAGIYARAGKQPLVDAGSFDIAALVEPEGSFS